MAETMKNYKKIKSFKCPDCGNRYTSLQFLINHIENNHLENIPDGNTIKQYLFNRRNNKSFGICVICKKNHTPWNELSGHYDRFCSAVCKAEAAKRAEENLKRKTGMTRSERMSNPETQKELLANRGTSGIYTFKDGKTTIGYASSYELDFLKFYENELHGDPLNLIECPFYFEYIFEGKKHTYIPDYFYFLGSECAAGNGIIIEIKDGALSNQTNKEIINHSHVMEKYKDEAVLKSGKYNFIKIRDMQYDDFIQVMEILKERNLEPTKNYEPIFINPDR